MLAAPMDSGGHDTSGYDMSDHAVGGRDRHEGGDRGIVAANAQLLRGLRLRARLA